VKYIKSVLDKVNINSVIRAASFVQKKDEKFKDKAFRYQHATIYTDLARRSVGSLMLKGNTFTQLINLLILSKDLQVEQDDVDDVGANNNNNYNSESVEATSEEGTGLGTANILQSIKRESESGEEKELEINFQLVGRGEKEEDAIDLDYDDSSEVREYIEANDDEVVNENKRKLEAEERLDESRRALAGLHRQKRQQDQCK